MVELGVDPTVPAAPEVAAAALRVTGAVMPGRTLSLSDLQRLPSRVLGPTDIVCMTGRYIERADAYRGAPLVEVLALTGLQDLPRSVLKACLVVARGGDGYRVVFTWLELFNTPVGAGVLVVYEKNHRELDARSGPLALISAGDLRLGPRHLRQLFEIEVLRLPA